MVTTKTKKPKMPTFLMATKTAWLCTDDKKELKEDIKAELTRIGWPTKKDAESFLGALLLDTDTKLARARITVTVELL